MSFLSGLKFLLSSEEKEQDNLNDNPNFITHPARIKHMLQMLVESHVQVTIILDDDSEATSRVLDISKNDLSLDQLNNRQAHNKMTKGSQLQIQAKHNSVPFNFTVSIIGTTNEGSYLISTPNKIYHPQKRAFFRVPLPDLEKYKFNGAIQYSENILSGYVYDISFGGICIAADSNTYVKKGSILSPASMVLQNGNSIHTDLTICSVKHSPQQGFTRIGCEFLNMEAIEKRVLHKFIAECERKRAKKTN